MKCLERRDYLNWLIKWKDQQIIKVVTGVRRCGHNIGNRTSPNTIANTLKSNQLKIDPKTVDRYIRGLTDSLLFYEVRRYNIKGKQFLASMNKYYVCDVAMRNMLVRSRETDRGHILENIVYLELARHYPEVYVGQWGTDGEVDFVAIRDGNPSYF